MTNDDFWPFYTEKLSDLDPTLVILLLLVTIYCYIKSAQKSDWILAEKVTFLFDFLSNTPVGVFLNFRSEFLELKKSDWILPEKVDCHLPNGQFVWLFVSFSGWIFSEFSIRNFGAQKKWLNIPWKSWWTFFCCCYWASYWSGFCLTFCQLALVVVKENNNCSSVTEKVSR